MHDWDQNALAKASGVSRAVVSFHLTGARPIRDDHLASYITALDKHEQAMLVAAWLQDTLPEAAAQNVLDSTTGTVREEVRTFTLGLSHEQQSMLKFWADKLAADNDLAAIFAAISRKSGWRASPETFVESRFMSVEPRLRWHSDTSRRGNLFPRASA